MALMLDLTTRLIFLKCYKFNSIRSSNHNNSITNIITRQEESLHPNTIIYPRLVLCHFIITYITSQELVWKTIHHPSSFLIRKTTSSSSNSTLNHVNWMNDIQYKSWSQPRDRDLGSCFSIKARPSTIATINLIYMLIYST